MSHFKDYLIVVKRSLEVTISRTQSNFIREALKVGKIDVILYACSKV